MLGLESMRPEKPDTTQQPSLRCRALTGQRASVVRAWPAVLVLACTVAERPGERGSESADSLSAQHAVAIVDSVRRMLADFTRLSAEAKWDSVARFYSADSSFRWIESGVVVARTTQTIQNYLAAMPPGTRVVTAYDSLEVFALGPGIASVVTSFTTHFGDTSATGVRFGGALSMLAVHRADGWVLLQGHASSPVPRGR